MAQRWELIITGKPIAQGRARAYKTPTGHIRMYDPPLSKDWKLWIRYCVLAQSPKQPSLAPMILRATFWMPRPKSLPKSVLYHTKKPDVDNLLKSCKDALTGIFFRDDAQIIRVEGEKRYAVVQSPGVVIELEEVS